MFEKVKEAFLNYTFLNPKDLIELASIIRIKHLKKGEHLVKEGEYNYYAVKVMSGLLYHYIIDENGMNKALLFVPAKMATGSLKTLILRKPSDENIVALENSILLYMDVRKLEKLADRNIRIMRMMNQSYKEIIVEASERIKFLILLTPQERYLHFRKYYPDLEERIKQKDLACYLGITNTSLSRLKAKLKNNNT